MPLQHFAPAAVSVNVFEMESQSMPSRYCTCALVLMLGCGSRTSPSPQVPVKQDYTVEQKPRSASAAQHELQPDLDAVRWLAVRVSAGYWGTTDVHALFYSDGTLQVEERWRDRTRRLSARLTAAELERLSRDMPNLEFCRRRAPEPDEIEEPINHGGSVTFENFKEPSRNLVIVYPAAKDNRPECLSYETFVVSLIKQTLEVEQPQR